ncbi:Uma2 family endonuclease [Hugenholtzia roseola]|uniref:Uma2 family endonuclease n=1 Tax=Hugenholtzia roseola TaxID=1002 RepID=UPI000407D479|nr:Uma2 family endonuclease [Hugenholtzia roseola]
MKPTILNFSELDLNGTYSYADYLRWHFEQGVELIKGKIFPMSPAPSSEHQRISSRLHVRLGNFLEQQNKGCEVYAAPFDVRLLDKKKSSRAHEDIYTVVQPDLCIICDKNKIDKRGCLGAPDLVIEILSEGNSKKEVKTKYELYQESGVQEYWVVYPITQVLLQFVLDAEGKYVLHNRFAEDEICNAYLFPELELDLGRVFAE